MQVYTILSERKLLRHDRSNPAIFSLIRLETSLFHSSELNDMAYCFSVRITRFLNFDTFMGAWKERPNVSKAARHGLVRGQRTESVSYHRDEIWSILMYPHITLVRTAVKAKTWANSLGDDPWKHHGTTRVKQEPNGCAHSPKTWDWGMCIHAYPSTGMCHPWFYMERKPAAHLLRRNLMYDQITYSSMHYWIGTRLSLSSVTRNVVQSRIFTLESEKNKQINYERIQFSRGTSILQPFDASARGGK